MKKPKFKSAGTVTDVVPHKGWDGGNLARVDLKVGGVRFHLYVPASHPFATLNKNDRIELTAGK